MGVFDKFKDLVGIEEYDDEITEEEIQETGAQLERKKIEPRSSYARRGKVVEMPGDSPFKLVVTQPEGFEECQKLVDSLRQKKPIILNLSSLDAETGRKIFDFLSGAAYALDGNVQKVAENIFIFAPDNVDIAAAAENSGFDFSGGSDTWR
ncbi:MAG: cell division protein SepF [Anaerovoracaceae bacterium]